MSNQIIDDDKNIEEKCSVCGRVLKMMEGRFRTPDQVYCVKCYYERHCLTTSKMEMEEE